MVRAGATAGLRPLGPVLTGGLLLPLHESLVALLGSLPAEAWLRRTSAGPWRVRDVAAHLLDGDLRRLSLLRDGWAPPPGVRLTGYADLLDFLNEMNAAWVRAAGRISPRLLVELLTVVGRASAEALAGLDPAGSAAYPVLWAGESASLNWMDVGREYTERWHHQDQIREAVGAPPLFEARWLVPVIQISVRALPRAYSGVDAAAGTTIVVRIEGESGGDWTLTRAAAGWALAAGAAENAACAVSVRDTVAARLLLHRLSPAEAASAVRVVGDDRLGRMFLSARAVMV